MDKQDTKEAARIKRRFEQAEVLASTGVRTMKALGEELEGVPFDPEIKWEFDEAQAAMDRLADAVTKYNTENYGR